MVKILWISKHEPLKVQREELKRRYGNVEIIWYPHFIKNAKHVVELMKKYEADEVVTVLPLTMIKHLVEMGVKPIIAKMEVVHICSKIPCPEYDPDRDFIDVRCRRHLRFKRFKRLVEIKLLEEEI